MNMLPPAPPGAVSQPAAAPHSVQEPGRFLAYLHLAVLTGFALAQPLYDRLGDRPAYVADMRVGFWALAVLAILLSLVVPLLLAGVIGGVGRLAPVARAPLFSTAIYALFALTLLPMAKRCDSYLPPWLVISLALAGAGGATWAYFAFRRIRSVVTAASPAIVVFPALFLFYSPLANSFFSTLQVKTTRWKPVPVVFLVLDELRGTTLVNEQNEIDGERYPNFAALAREATWFRNATTVYPDTWLAVPALLSGKYPTMKWVPQAADLPQNLFTVLDSTGAYDLVAFEPVTRLAPRRAESEPSGARPVWSQVAAIAPALARVYLVHLAPGELQKSLPKIPPLWFGMHEDGEVDRDRLRGVFRYSWGLDRRAQFEHFLDCIHDGPQPTLYFMHVLLPHIPWCYLPSGRKYLPESNEWALMDFNGHSETSDFWGTDELYVTQCRQRHFLQLQYADRLLGEFLARLRETGLYEKCLLVVTADHGICMTASETRRNATPTNLADIMSVPLFIKTPGQQAGAISDRNVESIDILPTIADVLGIDLQLPVDGVSVFDTVRPERETKILYRQDHPLRASSTIIREARTPQALRPWFEPAGDPAAVYRVGPRPELLGRNAEELSPDSNAPFEIELTRSSTSYSADPDELVPCFVEGRVVPPPRGEHAVHLAIAVNGTIQAVTRTYLLDGVRDRFSALLPESAYQIGENDVRYYVVSGEGSSPRLGRCHARPAARKSSR